MLNCLSLFICYVVSVLSRIIRQGPLDINIFYSAFPHLPAFMITSPLSPAFSMGAAVCSPNLFTDARFNISMKVVVVPDLVVAERRDHRAHFLHCRYILAKTAKQHNLVRDNQLYCAMTIGFLTNCTTFTSIGVFVIVFRQCCAQSKQYSPTKGLTFYSFVYTRAVRDFMDKTVPLTLASICSSTVDDHPSLYLTESYKNI